MVFFLKGYLVITSVITLNSRSSDLGAGKHATSRQQLETILPYSSIYSTPYSKSESLYYISKRNISKCHLALPEMHKENKICPRPFFNIKSVSGVIEITILTVCDFVKCSLSDIHY